MVDGLRSLEDGYIRQSSSRTTALNSSTARSSCVRRVHRVDAPVDEVGLFVGLSSVRSCRARSSAPNSSPRMRPTIVTIVCDDGWKYLSTGAWSDDIDDVVERAKKIIYF